MNHDQCRVVVTGMGVVSPLASYLEDFAGALKQGRSGVVYLPELQERGFGCSIAAVPQDYETAAIPVLGDRLVNLLPKSIGYACTAAANAWSHAGLAPPDPEGPVDWDTGAVIGTGIGDMDTIALKLVPMVNQGRVRRMGSRIVENVMHSGPSARVAALLGLGNQAFSNSSACSTGAEAVIEAMERIRSGRAKRMLAGGTEGPSPYTWSGFDAMRVLSRGFNDCPEKGSRPLSASTTGFVPGAGSAVLVLEELASALDRGADIHAEVLGGAVNCGGHRNGGTMTAPNPQGVRRCIQAALARARVEPGEVDAVSGHLTGTFADPLELKNWAAALDRHGKGFPWVNAPKSLFGHCLGAAGALESVAAVMQLERGFLHPCVNCEDLHPDVQPFAGRVVRQVLEPSRLRVMAKASFGFGDVNSCVVFKKWEGV